MAKGVRALVGALLLVICASVWADNPQVLIVTDQGNITVELDRQRAPLTVDNFLGYVDRYFYDGMIFHRVVKDFVIQSGGYTFDLTAKEPAEPVDNESANGLQNRRGTLAMARYADPDSARAQFYLNLSDNSNLDPAGDTPGYTVFGTVIAGMAVADAIGDTAVGTSGRFQHLPLEPIQILRVRRVMNTDRQLNQDDTL